MGEKTLPIITINRQYAAYGRSVAARLSEKLGIPYYDKDFIRKAVEQSGYSYEEIEQDGEAMSGPGRLFNDLMNVESLGNNQCLFRFCLPVNMRSIF